MKIFKFKVFGATSTSGSAPYTKVTSQMGTYYWYVHLDTGLYTASSPTLPIPSGYFSGKIDSPEYAGGDYILANNYTTYDFMEYTAYASNFPYMRYFKVQSPSTSPAYDTLWLESTDGNYVFLSDVYTLSGRSQLSLFQYISYDSGQTVSVCFTVNYIYGRAGQSHFTEINPTPTSDAESFYNIISVDSLDTVTKVYVFALDLRYLSSGTGSWYKYVYTSSTAPALLNFLNSATPVDPSEDPYTDKGESEEGGGEGSDRDDEAKALPTIPTASVLNTGFVTLFNPTESELKDLATYMWGTLDLTNWRRLFADPMDAILGLTIVPVSPTSTVRGYVQVGNSATTVAMDVVDTQYVTLDCGSLYINEYWGCYLDYQPYTTVEIYLPYIGVKTLDTNEIMGRTISLTYYIDILSGQCVANIIVSGTRHDEESYDAKVLYSFTGSCCAQLPISGTSFSNLLNSAVSTAVATAGAIVATVASGGMGTPIALTAMAGLAGSGISNAANAAKQNIERAGSIGGMAGFLAEQTPYIIITYANQALPANQNQYTGYPSLITETLGDLTGFTVVRDIHMQSSESAMKSEIDEIVTLLKEGVIL